MGKPPRTEETVDLLVAYTGTEHLTPETYANFFDAWAARLAKGERFGVVLVTEPHEHDHSEVRDPETEDRFTRVLSNFRREHRERANELTTGFSRVFPPEMLAGMDEERTAWYEARTSRFTEYTFGVRGKNFTSLGEAVGWLGSVKNEAPLDLAQEALSETGSAVGFYYGSTTGTTEFVAEKMQRFAERAGVTLKPVNIGNLKDPKELLAFDKLILGGPTWNVGQLQDDWLILFPKLDELDFSGKQVALFGVGDQLGYPDNFLDALGILGKKLEERGATLVGFWSTKGYDFTASKAQVGGQFMGLGVDEYNQEELTDSRVASWLGQVQREFGAAKEVTLKARLEPAKVSPNPVRTESYRSE